MKENKLSSEISSIFQSRGGLMPNNSDDAPRFCLNDLPKYDMERLYKDVEATSIAKGGVAAPFPWRLHKCLEAVQTEGLDHIIRWQPHGRSFTVCDPLRFVELVLPRFFNQTRYASFQRQLNIYGFQRFAHGKDKGAYFHLCFVREERSLVRKMVRSKFKGNKHLPRKPPCASLYNFYHEAWRQHQGSNLPEELQALAGDQDVVNWTAPHHVNTTKSEAHIISSDIDSVLHPPLSPTPAGEENQGNSHDHQKPVTVVSPPMTPRHCTSFKHCASFSPRRVSLLSLASDLSRSIQTPDSCSKNPLHQVRGHHPREAKPTLGSIVLKDGLARIPNNDSDEDVVGPMFEEQVGNGIAFFEGSPFQLMSDEEAAEVVPAGAALPPTGSLCVAKNKAHQNNELGNDELALSITEEDKDLSGGGITKKTLDLIQQFSHSLY